MSSGFEDEPRLPPIIIDKPKVKLIRNAKGDPQWEITVVDGVTDAHMDALRAQAVRQWRALLDELLDGAGAGA